MYCSACGVAVAQNLSYCNFCGVKLNGTTRDAGSPHGKPENLIVLMTMVFVFGLGAISVLLGVLRVIMGLSVGQILPFAILGFLIMLSIESLCVWLFLRRVRGTDKAVSLSPFRKPDTQRLNAPDELLLPEPASVTEHTTRTFDPVYIKRKE